MCGEQPRHAFAPWALNRSKTSQKIRCIDCSHPPCSKPGCTTCRKCHSESCRLGELCSSGIEAVAPSLQPRTLDEKQQFLYLACQTVPCYVCGEQPRDAFDPAALRNRKNSQNLRCIDCSHPPCSQASCTTCKKCRSESSRQGDFCASGIEALPPSLQPKTLDDKQRFLCLACQTVPCHVCGDQPRDAFDPAALRNRKDDRNLRCIDCNHPPCSRAACTTCKTCRDVSCRDVSCLGLAATAEEPRREE